MPGDLRDPAQFFPFYYDSRYEHSPNPTELSGLHLMDPIIQDIASEVLGRRLGKEELLNVHQYLFSIGMMCRNPGDESFMNTVREYLTRQVMSRRVARKWLILTSC